MPAARGREWVYPALGAGNVWRWGELSAITGRHRQDLSAITGRHRRVRTTSAQLRDEELASRQACIMDWEYASSYLEVKF